MVTTTIYNINQVLEHMVHMKHYIHRCVERYEKIKFFLWKNCRWLAPLRPQIISFPHGVVHPGYGICKQYLHVAIYQICGGWLPDHFCMCRTRPRLLHPPYLHHPIHPPPPPPAPVSSYTVVTGTSSCYADTDFFHSKLLCLFHTLFPIKKLEFV
jgi:hypothetical protein